MLWSHVVPQPFYYVNALLMSLFVLEKFGIFSLTETEDDRTQYCQRGKKLSVDHFLEYVLDISEVLVLG